MKIQRTNPIFQLALALLCVLFSFLSHGQQDLRNSNSSIRIKFKPHPKQIYGFDSFQHEAWESEYEYLLNGTKKTYIHHKSVAKNEQDWVQVKIQSKTVLDFSKLNFQVNKAIIPYSIQNDSILSIQLPKMEKEYVLKAFYDSILVTKLNVDVFAPYAEKVVIVPLVRNQINSSEIQKYLNDIYKQASIQLDVSIMPVFKTKIFDQNTRFSPADSTHKVFSGQMRLLRDAFFEQNPSASKNAHYIFIISGFTDSSSQGYMPLNKSLAFIPYSSNFKTLQRNIAQTLAFGIGALHNSWENEGPERGSTSNLMDDSEGTHLTFFQWTELRQNPNFYSFFDNEENVKTNNGTIAYYFWEEDDDGNLIGFGSLLDRIKRPYKKNFLSYRFQVKYGLLRPFYKWGNYYISMLNILFILLIILILAFIRKGLVRFWERRGFKGKFWRRVLFLLVFGVTAFHMNESFRVSNHILDYFKKISGPLNELEGMSYHQAKNELLTHNQLLHKEELNVSSEILIQRNQKWELKKRMRVLYFQVKKDTIGMGEIVRFVSSSDSLHIYAENYHAKAQGHYMVFNYYDERNQLEKQEIYSHLGKNLTTDFNEKEDVAKRIVVFVNGYRPTSIGHSFEENFRDIRNNGLEFPNSKNYIFDFDRYDYWKPWNEINLLFQKRFNASEAYYADGHFSVSTSNFRSLLNFTTISQNYPKRCKNPKKHICHNTKNTSYKKILFAESRTTDQLKMSANKDGFKLRKRKGKIAGRNLIQVLNEIPNHSKNDTLFLVAHSMGYAYSLGMIEELRGKVNFGSFIIIAPENAKSGKVNMSEWQEIWQYGSNFNQHNSDAPCLQDGVAPQSKAGGLSVNQRVYIPENLYSKKGFFDSHFVGYYTWIFNVPEQERGYIKQR
jgi:hypothetical protein